MIHAARPIGAAWPCLSDIIFYFPLGVLTCLIEIIHFLHCNGIILSNVDHYVSSEDSSIHGQSHHRPGFKPEQKINTYLRNNNLICWLGLVKHKVCVPSSVPYEVFSELSGLLPALECPKSKPEFICGFCDYWRQQVRFCWQFQNRQRSPEGWSALCRRSFAPFVFGWTASSHLKKTGSAPLGRGFDSLPSLQGSMSFKRRWLTINVPGFSLTNVLCITHKKPLLLRWENPHSTAVPPAPPSRVLCYPSAVL